MSGKLQQLAELSPDRRAALQQILRERTSARAAQQEIRPRGTNGPVPLSFAQQRLWFIDQLEPGTPTYNMLYTARLRGPLDVAALRGAFTAVARRHEVLRTTFESCEGEPVQVIHPSAPVPLPLFDLGRLGAAAAEREARRLARAEALRPFDLARGPLLRSTLVHLGGAEHVLIYCMHHIISDGWSLGVQVRELSAHYAACAGGRQSSLPELPVQYADYSVWQRARLTEEFMRSQVAYWRKRLAGAPPLLELPTDRAAAAGHSQRAAHFPFDVPAGVAGPLRALGQRAGATPYMVVLAAWQLLLSRYSGQDDVVVGTPIGGRARVELEGLIGLFVNMLALRADLSGDPTFSRLLGQVRDTTLGAYQHQDVPFERVVDELKVERSLTHGTLFQVIFALEQGVAAERDGLALGEVEVETFGEGSANNPNYLDLKVTDRGDRLSGQLKYRTALFDAETIRRMVEHFQAVLEAVATDPERRIAEIDLLGPAARERILVDWNDTAVAYPPASLHGLIAAQAARTPASVAVVFEDETLTYAELDARAGCLARRLRALGVGPETRVAVCLERSVEMVVALLGVLKAGAAYVPVDPEYPAERIAYMLEDARAAVLLTDEARLSELPLHGARVLCMDGAEEAHSLDGASAPEAEAWPESLAYVIYTSGSTGRPKGAMNAHSGIVNRLLWMQEEYGLTQADVVLQKTPFSFDVSVWEFFWPLLAGARLVLAKPEAHRDPAYLSELIEREGVTTLHFVPPMLQAFLDAGDPGRCGSLRRVVCSGEALAYELAERFFSALPGVGLHNLYGPTEAAVDVTYWTCEPRERRVVPIGRPVANTRVYVLDGSLNPVPVGVGGELFIAGVQVGRGYLGRPELTAERFVPDALSIMPGARLYRTGDRVRWSAGGEMEYLGRSDHQVKVRGFRVEPGEIEAALRGHASVQDAVVLLREDAPGERRLVAYVVSAEQGEQVSGAELRAYLAQRLAEYMVPGSVMVLEALPLTPNGKVDRRALPAPEWSGEAAYVAPRTPAEEVLAGIWTEVLHAERVGAQDNFFERGGHSLLATRVVSRVRQAFGVELPLRALFEAPTVAGLAERIGLLRADGESTQAPPLVRVARDGSTLPLSYAQQRLWFIDQLEPGSAAYNMPRALRLRGRFDPAVLEWSLTEIVRRHETLRTVFATVEGEPVQVVRDAGPVVLPVTDLRSLPPEPRETQLRRLAREEAARPFDLAAGPLLRVTALRLDDAEWGVLLTMHHIVSDGWSMEVLIREVSALYNARVEGCEAELPELAVQYADYTAWQRAWLTGETLEAKLGFWREQLRGSSPLLELPTDRPRPQVQEPRGGIVGVKLPVEVSSELRTLSRREGATAFMTLLAAWQLLLSRYAGVEDVSVGTPIAGRTRLEMEPLIGFFVNTLVLRTDLSGEPSFRELLGRVRETTLAAYQHQEIPFERLVEELAPERSLSHAPLFQVMFVLQNHERGALRMGELEMEPLAAGSGEAFTKFDLTLGLAEDEEGFAGSLSYRAELWDRATMERMAEHFTRLVEALVTDASLPAVGVAFLTDEERARVLLEWNATGREYPLDCIHDLVEAQARRTPGAVAAVCGAEHVTYGELDRRADRLAALLARRGIGLGSHVPVLMERGLEVPLAMLGVMKAGAAFSPLDVRWPAARVREILDDLGCDVVLVGRDAPFTEAELGRSFLRVDLRDAEEANAAPRTAVHAGPGDPIYVIYTSGSTGKPKGVVVPHRGIANRFRWMDEYFGRQAAGAVLQTTRHVFDSAVWQLFWPLTGGGRTVLPASDDDLSAGPLTGLIREQRVTMTDFVPSVFNVLVPWLLRDEEVRRSLESLRAVVVGGEQITPGTTYAFMRRFSGVAVVNLYGPTEASIGCVCYRVTGDEGGRIPIGRPISNTQALVLDERRRLVPVRVPGELYLSGACLAAGYLNDPDRTRAAFVENPFAEPGSERMYRTGDRVRWLADGNLEFLGRTDAQVKVRGFRIEPGEIEAVLREQDGVRDAVVVVRGTEGDRRLVAYAAGEGAELDGAVLRAGLRERLPEHMVPAAVVVLKALPLTPVGKVDRRALPEPVWGGEAYVAPHTPAQEILAGIWAEVLRVGRVGAEDNFFDVGGHSLLATRVVSRVRQAFGVELPLRALFEVPTVAGLAERVEALLAGGEDIQAPPLVVLPRDGSALPLSFAQQRLWFIDQLEPGSAAYNMPHALRLRGRFDPAVLERSLTEIVRRHETLRTVFATVDGEPVQVVRDAAPVVLPVTDLRSLRSEPREAEVRRLAREEAARPFDLAAGPLLRVSAVRLGEAEWGVLFTMHHVVSDGWSIGILIREVSALYDAFSEGREAGLPELPVQYADYAAWQRGWLTGETLEARLAYWHDRLADAPPLLELLTDRPRPQAQDPRGASVRVDVPAEVSAELRALSRREGATAFMTLLAAWQLLLSRYAGVEDVSVGTPIAGRTRLETEPLIGFFVNTLVLRTDLSGEPTFRELLGRVRETTLGAYQHQEIPFERLVEELAPERSLAHSPLFQAMFVLQNNERGGLRMGELKMEPLAAGGEEIAKFDLTLGLAEDEHGFAGSLSYRAALWDAVTMERMAAHFGALLARVVAEPARPLAHLELLDAAEREQLLGRWSGSQHGAQPPVCVHEAFAEQTARTPDALALVYQDRALSYAELERAANQLAHRLVRLGVGPDVRVGICIERSPELVVGLLGILKAGGAYVPLDPHYPAERLAFMLADADAPVLLTQERFAERFAGFGGSVVLLDREAAQIAAESEAAPKVRVTSEHLVYVIYTSGSTGQPKGTEVPHRAIAGFFRGVDYVRFDETTVLLQHASVSWDVLTLELWPALLSGGRCVLYPGTASEPSLLGEQVREHGVNTLWLTAAYFNLILDTCPEILAGVTQVMTGGEAVSATHARRALELYPELRLVNGYGPSECTVFATCYAVPADFSAPSVPVGRPVGDRRVYLLDGHLAPVPRGAPGEVCIGGPAVARGYLNRAELTAEKFVPDPFSGEAGARLYRSGDRARWRGDGELEFMGRVDLQVKIRGFRVEPGEVESVLGRHPRVRQAAAVVRADGGERCLVGYVTAEPGQSVSGPEVRAWLAERLPEHMVPSAVVVLEAMPLTDHGKLDRRALPAPESWEGGASYVTPRTPAEEVLAGIVADVLRVERVGAEDNFFELGGHSLLATRVVSRVRQAFGVELPLRALFEAPTVAGLAGRIGWLQAGDEGMQAPPLARVARDGSALPLSYAQQRLWFIDQLEPGSAAYNIPFALRLRGRFDPAVLERSLTEIVRRHETLRTVFATVDGEPVQVVRDAGPVVLPVTDLRSLHSESREAEVRRLAREEATRSFDLAAGPLLRVSAVRLDETEWGVLVTMHHVVSDGWSMGVLIREVSALYDALSEGREAGLPELAVQYADYAAWQRGWLTGETLEGKLGFWREQLRGTSPLLELPTDRPRPQAQDPRGGVVGVKLPVEVSSGLRALSRREGATPFMTLLAAWQLLLARYAGVEDVSVGTPIAGRTRLETEPLIGFFVNTLVLRTDLSGEPSFRELLGRVRETTLGAYQHQEIPFERLVEVLAPERSLAHSPLFQVMFVLQNNDRSGLRMGELEMEPLAAGGEEIAKFDLTLGLAEDEQGFAGSLSYRAELWERATIERMAGHFARLVEAVLTNPGRPVSGVAFLGEEERAQVLEEWNGSAGSPAEECVHELFAAQAARTPDAPAVSFAGETLTYAGLDRRSNRLAHALRTLGVGPEVTTALCLERSPDMVVAMLAILKAGGAYVPLDPASPPERVAYMVEDSGARVLLTRERHLDVLPAGGGARVLCLDREAALLQRQRDTAPEVRVLPRGLAYVIYTSGSTGRPKGVLVEHRSLAAFLHAMRREPGISADDALLAVTTLSFDIAGLELFLPLLAGARTVLADRETASDPLRLAGALAAAGATMLQATPATWRMLLAAGWEGRPELRALCGGEALAPDLAEHLLTRVYALWNLYGPTETTVWSTLHRVRSGGGAPIGRPISGTRVYVLDGDTEPVPPGVQGELLIGGAGVARGYHGRPELTAERFLPDPFSAEPGARMYRTGDRVRWLARGELEYLGRIDQQVKLRGFRIEPGEIEAALLEEPSVREAAVLAREDHPGERRLVGYVVAPGGDVAGLREHLRKRLPEYMVPSAFVVLHSLPLTPNGKLDRKALPAPERAGGEDGEHVAPRDALELELVRIWEDLLGVSPVGVTDDFFALGGHSLLAVRMLSHLADRAGKRLPLAVLFAGATIERLVAAVRRHDAPPPSSPLVRIRPAGSRRPLFLVHPAGGNVVCYLGLARHLDAAQPLFALQSRGLGVGEAPHDSIEAMAADYLRQLRAAQPAGPYRLGGWSMGGVVAFEMARRLAEAGEAVELLTLVDSVLAAGPHAADELVLLRDFALHLGMAPERLAAQEAAARTLEPDARLDLLRAAALEAGVVPLDLDLAGIRRLYGVYRANVRALRRYRPGSYPGSAVLLRASGEAGRPDSAAAAGGWDRHIMGGVEVRPVPGDHFGLLREPHVRSLARELADSLERAPPSSRCEGRGSADTPQSGTP